MTHRISYNIHVPVDKLADTSMQLLYCCIFVRIIIVSYYLKLHRYIVDANLPASSFVVVVFINIYNERRWESICIYMDI